MFVIVSVNKLKYPHTLSVPVDVLRFSATYRSTDYVYRGRRERNEIEGRNGRATRTARTIPLQAGIVST